MKPTIGLLVLAALLSGCGATKIVTTTETQVETTTSVSIATRTVTKRVKPAPTSPAAPPSSTSSSAATPSGGSTLTIQDFDGNTLRVAANGVIDPASPADPAVASVKADQRLIAVELTLSNTGPGTISDDANSDLAVIGSDSQDYTPDFDDVAECTNFNDGDYTLANGSTQKGCVVFELPNAIKVESVQFSLGGNTVEFKN